MKIALDLDDTIVTNNVVYLTSKKLFEQKKIRKIYTRKDVCSFNMFNLPDILKKHITENYKNPKFAVWNCRRIDGVCYFLNYLKSNNHKIYIITARPENLLKDTKDYIESEFKNKIDELYFANSTSDVPLNTPTAKHNVLKKLNPDVFVDDRFQHCLEAKNLGIKTFLIRNKHTPWNHGKHDKDIYSIKSLCHIPIETFK